MEIPYTSAERPDTGLYNGKMGIWLFLGSEVMLFGALFSSYILLRYGATDWPLGASILNIPLATLNTVVLISSSVTMVMAWVALKMNDLKKSRLYIALTIACAFIFLIVKAFEYSAKFSHHHFPSESTFLAIYFVLTGLHGIHVVGGIVVLLYHWGPGSKMWHSHPVQYTNRIEVTGLYWHFVDLVWIFLFPVLYLL